MEAVPTIRIVVLLAIIFGVLIFALLVVGVVFVICDTIRKRGKWGINLKPPVCAQCGTRMPWVRTPTSWQQALWGGWTCPECGLELDKWGQPVGGQVPGKWAILRAIEETDQRRHRRQSCDERIRNVNDQLQRGDSL